MRLRTPALLAALIALIASVLSALPAEAASKHYAKVTSSRIALWSNGTGQVKVSCTSKKKACKGKISFVDDSGTPRARTYKVSARKSKYVSVALNASSPDNPHRAAAVPGRDFKAVSNVRLRVAETSPRRFTHYYTKITTETRLSKQDITGTVRPLAGTPVAGAVKVQLIQSIRGGNERVVKTQSVSGNGGRYRFAVSLGANNGSSKTYRLRISGNDQNGIGRSWYWRGSDAKAAGGGAYLRDGSAVRASRYSDFNADFAYGSISGTTAARAEVTVASPPPSFGGGRTALRELDIPRCANVFGQTRASSSGTYTVGFLPATGSQSNRYMVGVKNGTTQAWYGKTSARFGSCYDATNYKYQKSNLITLTSTLTKSLNASASGNKATIKAKYSSKFKPTTQGDRWVRLREKVPGVPVLDSPVVAESLASKSGTRAFYNLRPGTYWVEVGRRTGCSDWYPSKYPNNNAYFKGNDRGPERWKAFRKLSSLQGGKTSGLEGNARRAQPNPATNAQNKVRRGYSGWMYRGYCKAYGVGTVNTMRITGTGRTVTKTTSTNAKGAVVKGRVTRTGGRSNKEIMVRLSSSKGTRVIRTDITDSKGTFYIAGLAPGKWTISVNSDSWRGIGRKFTGRKSVTVKAGKGYNVGKLRFKG